MAIKKGVKKKATKLKSELILILNGGSSSIKLALFETPELKRVFEGKIERISLPKSILIIKGENAKEVNAPNHKTALDIILNIINERYKGINISAVGHRIVHGGPRYIKAEIIDKEMLSYLHEIKSFDPEHLPSEIMIAEETMKRLPSAVQVACFDTAFHNTMPETSKILPIPRKYYDKGVRRYGFHGTSYAYLMEELSRIDSKEAKGKIIIAHMGNGVSLVAIKDGKCIDTTMAFTPTAGVSMSTRSGDLDPGIVLYLAKNEGIDAERFNKIINSESGLLGVSEISSDMRDLLDKESNDKRAKEAIDLFCYQIKKQIGAYSAALGGIDTIIFSAGMGENAPKIRERICRGLEFLGIKLDAKNNELNDTLISTKDSKVKIRVIKTDEELMIAKTTVSFINRKK
jgi:acetate kinase